MESVLEAAIAAHQAALDAQLAMRAAAKLRDEAVRAAVAAGWSTKDLAAELGVIQRRVQAMVSGP